MTDLLRRFDHLLLPCRDNASPDHWQSHWQNALPHMTRVEQDEWVSPTFAAWAARLDEHVARASRPVVLIAHSLGTSLIMHWAPKADTSRIAGAFMVAPSDRGPADIWPDATASGFAPMVLAPLPFPAMVLASRNDPYVSHSTVHRSLPTRGGARSWTCSSLVTWGTQPPSGSGQKGWFISEPFCAYWKHAPDTQTHSAQTATNLGQGRDRIA
jgi:uncharacterized protein